MTEEELNRLEALAKNVAKDDPGIKDSLAFVDAATPPTILSLIRIARVGLAAETVKAEVWDKAMEAAKSAARLAMVSDPSIDEYSCSGCAAAIRALVNPYRSKTNG